MGKKNLILYYVIWVTFNYTLTKSFLKSAFRDKAYQKDGTGQSTLKYLISFYLLFFLGGGLLLPETVLLWGPWQCWNDRYVPLQWAKINVLPILEAEQQLLPNCSGYAWSAPLMKDTAWPLSIQMAFKLSLAICPPPHYLFHKTRSTYRKVGQEGQSISQQGTLWGQGIC